MAQIFTISDGTTTIDLLNPTGNYHLASWETGINSWKDEGYYNNPLNELSVPTNRFHSNFEEKLSIHVTGTTQDSVIANTRAFVALLEKSINYFVNNSSPLVYLSAKSDTETNTRYAVIFGYKLEELPDQFIGPFTTGGKQQETRYGAIYANISCVITRSYWLGNIPPSSTAMSIINQYSYNSTNYGLSSSTTDKPITSKDIMSNITHIYRFDASAGSWSGNLLGSGLPYNLLPTSTQANDALYIGVNTALANSGPFSNVIFNITTPSSGITGTWQYRLASSWDNIGTGGDYTQNPPGTITTTNSFTKTGMGEITFTPPDLWATGNLQTIFGGSAPNVTGYWIRFNVTSVSSPSVPQQGSVQPYSASKPYIEITSGASGDLDALSKITIRGRNTTKALFGPGSYYAAGSLFLGIRKYSRGSNFTAYLNCADEQNPSGVTVTLGSSSFQSDATSPTGRSVTTSIGASSTNPSAVSITLDNTISNHYFGKFRVFWRGGVVSGSNNQISLKIRTNEIDLYTSPYLTIPIGGAAGKNVVDFGIINIPNSDMLNSLIDTPESIEFAIGLKNSRISGTNIVWSYDLVFIPADESIIEVRELLNDAFGEGLYYNKLLEIDNLTQPFKSTRTITKNSSTGYVNGLYRLINYNGVRLPRERFRIWFLYYDRYLPLTTADQEFTYASWDSVFTIKVDNNPVYLLPRGTA